MINIVPLSNKICLLQTHDKKNNIFCNLRKFKHKIYYYLYFTIKSANSFRSIFEIEHLELDLQRRDQILTANQHPLKSKDKYLGANTLNLFRSGATKYLSPLVSSVYSSLSIFEIERLKLDLQRRDQILTAPMEFRTLSIVLPAITLTFLAPSRKISSTNSL